MKHLLKLHTQWAKKAREEFKKSDFYTNDIGENFTVSENGNIYLKNGQCIPGIATPWEHSNEYHESPLRKEDQRNLDLLSMSIMADELEKDFDFLFLSKQSDGKYKINKKAFENMYHKFKELKDTLETYVEDAERELINK